jgi:ABC-type methionine transport system permease subunit
VSELGELLWQSTLETLAMVGASLVLAGAGGLVLGVLLVVSARDGVLPIPWLHRVLTVTANVGRSIPFIILMVALIPVTRWIVGTSIGTAAAIVPLVIGAVPYAARLVQSALLEVDRGLVQAVVAMGATPWQVVHKAYLPEARPALLRAATLMAITLISFSAMAGAIGGGGLGDLAIRYGYQRFRPGVTICTVVVLVALVQVIQYVGDALARRVQR